MEWKKRDGSLEETSGQLENHNHWLHFDSVSLEDDGEYECRASNSHGSTAHSFTVTVEGTGHGPHCTMFTFSNIKGAVQPFSTAFLGLRRDRQTLAGYVSPNCWLC